MKSSVFGAAQTFNRLRSTLNTGAVHAGARQPFKFLLCGDPALVAAFRSVLLAGTGSDTIPLDAAAALETFALGGPPVDRPTRGPCCSSARPADRAGAPVEALDRAQAAGLRRARRRRGGGDQRPGASAGGRARSKTTSCRRSSSNGCARGCSRI